MEVTKLKKQNFNRFRIETWNKLGYSEQMKKNFFSNAESYFAIYALTKNMLNEYFTSNKIESKALLNVEHFAETFGFSVQREHLNIGRQRNLGLILGRLEKKQNMHLIYLELEDTITEQQERYTIAYLLGYYFMQSNDEQQFSVECAEVRIPQTSREFNASIFATFLLLQPDKFFEEVEKYISKTERPISQEAFLLEMSKWAKVPYHFTIISYEYLKIIAGLYYNTEFKNKLIEKLSEGNKTIFNEVLEEKKLLPDEFFY